ncbi:HDOD domain-containing protein [Propionivibrio limicola]|uniref:HDOD domain-containing protein n=1 Tax=Propionivibrio limicola TaxID=167645 RepID=UPI00129182CD|nr:HDOD domain-containing protein [Propionivibrio limicola]
MTAAPTLDELVRHAGSLPSLPEAVNHVMRSLADENADIDSLAQHISADPAIVARLLAAANAVSSGVSTPICSARQAFLFLGVNRVVSIVLASTLLHRYDIRNPGFNTRQLWRHALGVATCARLLAEQTRLNADLAFTAGLLHDIGQLLMFSASPTRYLKALDLHNKGDMPIVDAERALFGVDHATAGGLLAETWKLPGKIRDAIEAHHEPDQFGTDIGDLIHASEVLSHALDLGEPQENRVPALSDRACATLGLSWSKLSGHFAEIEARYDGLCIALGI